MNLNFRTLAALCSVAVSLSTGCRSTDSANQDSGSSVSPLFSSQTQQATVDIQRESVTEADLTPAQDPVCTVTFSEDSIGIRGEGVQVDGKAAVISSGGVYSVSGECSDGRLVIDSSEAVSLMLSGLVLSSADIVLEHKNKDSVLVLTLVGEENVLSGSGIAIYSEGTVTINGSGGLELAAENAVSCDVLKLCGGSVSMNTTDDAVVSGSYVLSAAGDTAIRSGGDGIRVSASDGSDGYFSMTGGELDINSAEDGIYVQNAAFIDGGELKLTCGGGSSAVMHFSKGGRYPYAKHGGFSTDGSTEFDFDSFVSGDGSKAVSKKGIKSGGIIDISGGTAQISSADDCLQARYDIGISGGDVRLSSGDDGIHCDGSLTISDGSLIVAESYNALEGMSVTIEGGETALHSYRDGIAAAGGSEVSGTTSQSEEMFISITGGSVTVDAGGDGIDSAGHLAVSGGVVRVFSAAQEGFGSMVYADSFALTGGSFAAFGSDSGSMAPSIVSGVCVSVYAQSSAGSLIELMDSNGNVILNEWLIKDCGSVIIWTDAISSGESYTLTADGMQLAQIKATEGVCGGGPNGRDTGGAITQIADEFQSGSNMIMIAA